MLKKGPEARETTVKFGFRMFWQWLTNIPDREIKYASSCLNLKKSQIPFQKRVTKTFLVNACTLGRFNSNLSKKMLCFQTPRKEEAARRKTPTTTRKRRNAKPGKRKKLYFHRPSDFFPDQWNFMFFSLQVFQWMQEWDANGGNWVDNAGDQFQQGWWLRRGGQLTEPPTRLKRWSTEPPTS